MTDKKSYPRYGRKRLALDIPSALHTEIKIRSTKHQCTITAYVLRALLDRVNVERDIDGLKKVS